MESQRFDELTRGLAASRSRRSLLRAFAGGLIGLAGAGLANRPAGAAACVDDGDCGACETCAGGVCTTTCGDGMLCCQAAGSFVCAVCCEAADCGEGMACVAGACVPACATDADCAPCEICNADTGECIGACDPGQRCCTGVCAACCNDSDCGFVDDYNCVNGICVPQTCAGEFDSCGSGCCYGLICVSDGLYCARFACQTDDDCAGVYIDDIRPCILGVCTGRQSGVGEPCETDAHCDLAWCAAGVCAPLGVLGDLCTRGAQCATGRCLDGLCAPKCHRKGHTCHVDTDCCEGLVCADRLCVVPEDGGSTDGGGGTGGEPDTAPEPDDGTATTLPATGSGHAEANDNADLLGLGAVVAAALVAADRIRPNTPPAADD